MEHPASLDLADQLADAALALIPRMKFSTPIHGPAEFVTRKVYSEANHVSAKLYAEVVAKLFQRKNVMDFVSN